MADICPGNCQGCIIHNDQEFDNLYSNHRCPNTKACVNCGSDFIVLKRLRNNDNKSHVYSIQCQSCEYGIFNIYKYPLDAINAWNNQIIIDEPRKRFQQLEKEDIDKLMSEFNLDADHLSEYDLMFIQEFIFNNPEPQHNEVEVFVKMLILDEEKILDYVKLAKTIIGATLFYTLRTSFLNLCKEYRKNRLFITEKTKIAEEILSSFR